MKQEFNRLDELKIFILEALESYGLESLYAENAIEDYWQGCQSHSENLYRLAQRIADEIIFSYHKSLTNAAAV